MKSHKQAEPRKMRKTKLVTTLTRDTDEAYGEDYAAKVYQVVQDDGTCSFAVSLFCGGHLSACEDNYISYGHAMVRAVQWIDNSQFHL
jgi:hypothetical protein